MTSVPGFECARLSHSGLDKKRSDGVVGNFAHASPSAGFDDKVALVAILTWVDLHNSSDWISS